jgi:hypothetical protein
VCFRCLCLGFLKVVLSVLVLIVHIGLSTWKYAHWHFESLLFLTEIEIELSGYICPCHGSHQLAARAGRAERLFAAG